MNYFCDSPYLGYAVCLKYDLLQWKFNDFADKVPNWLENENIRIIVYCLIPNV